MIIFINSNSEIKDVGTTKDPSLTRVELSDNPNENPFVGWTIPKICCYKAQVNDGVVSSISPYISSSIVELIDRLARENEELRARANKTDRELDQLLTDVIPRLMG